jgi:hypothetical protein
MAIRLIKAPSESCFPTKTVRKRRIIKMYIRKLKISFEKKCFLL